MTQTSADKLAGYGSPTQSPDGRPLSMAERVASARRKRMVGREQIIAEFSEAIAQDPFPYCILQIYGPGGVGKTTLLDALSQKCREVGFQVISVDAAMVEPTPVGFLRLVGRSLKLDEPFEVDRVQEKLFSMNRFVLMIDTYESVGPLDGWLRNDFLPQLPGSTLVIMAGRKAPSPAWRSDPGWQSLVRTIALRNFSPDESRDYLNRRQIPAEQHDDVLRFTHGYPLGLSLIADLYSQHGKINLDMEGIADIVPVLLERLLEEAPSALQRTALQACALVRWTTEPLLANVLGEKEAGTAFDWLRGLSFIEAGPGGLCPHETARESLMADLKWRNPDRHIELHRRASDYYAQRVQNTTGDEQQRTLFDFVYLHRDNHVVADAFTWPDNISIYGEPITPSDIDELTKMVTTHEGVESAAIFRLWMKHPASWGQVYRKSQASPKQAIGFAMSIALERLSPGDADFDPGTSAAVRLLASYPPLRPGECATLSRFWMDAENYQGVSAVQSVIVLTGVRYYLTAPGLAYTIFPSCDPDFWEAAYRYAEMHRLPAADFEIAGTKYGMFGHDWRSMPPLQWLELLAQREVGGDSGLGAPPPQTSPLLVLSKPDFASSVKHALKHYPRSESLADNLLLRSRLVAERSKSDNEAERSEKLRELVRAAADDLLTSGKRKVSHQAIMQTYIEPKGSQEDVADEMDVPFSTYRRHLTTGIDLITESLWALEVGA